MAYATTLDEVLALRSENAKLRAALSTAIDWIDPVSDPMPLKNGEIVALLRMVLRFNDEQAGSCADWIEWRGGQCPLPAGTLFEYRLRNGGTGAPLRTPTAWKWEHDGGEYDIVAYRVSSDEQAADRKP